MGYYAVECVVVLTSIEYMLRAASCAPCASCVRTAFWRQNLKMLFSISLLVTKQRQRIHMASAMDDSNKENLTRSGTRHKLMQELQQNPNNPAGWLQLVSHELALVGGDVKRCSTLGKVFESARQAVTKEFFQTDEYAALSLGNARWFMYVQHDINHHHPSLYIPIVLISHIALLASMNTVKNF